MVKYKQKATEFQRERQFQQTVKQEETMKRYELSIRIDDSDYTDSLIVSLARMGHSPYISDDGSAVCITIDEEDLIEIKVER